MRPNSADQTWTLFFVLTLASARVLHARVPIECGLTCVLLPVWQNSTPTNPIRCPYDSVMPPSGHQVSDERLEDFRRIYKRVYGQELTLVEAREMTRRLLALYDLL